MTIAMKCQSTPSTGMTHSIYPFAFSIQSCRSCYARLYLCQRPFYKILVKVRNSKKNVLKIVLIIVNINEDENKSLISNKLSLKNDL
jgi:biotin synthase-related radical SAM superfamily protein